MDYTSHYIEIPSVFYSDESGLPFARCLGCDTFLLDDGTQYVIEKAYRQYPDYGTRETVFEYAMCLNCFAKLQEAMSEESLTRVRSYFDQHVNLESRRKMLLQRDDLKVEDWLEFCLIKGTPITELKEFQIIGHCDGNDLLFTLFPYAIGSDAIDEISMLLSNKTLGEIDGFMDEHFGFPPELRQLLLDNKMFV